MNNLFREEDWPAEAEQMYERIEVLGKGSFGLVWMCQRKVRPQDEFDDEFVALKNIEIKEEKGKVYAQREISILAELKHPNVIRLIRAFPVYDNISRLVALQLARGPNLQRIVGKRGALGIHLCRLVSRELVAAVSYLHGRGVLHRDIKPTNLILENTELRPIEYYDYSYDNSIWSDGPEALAMVKRNKWKVMLVDFGFARALESNEVYLNEDDGRSKFGEEGSRRSKRHMRNSIALESSITASSLSMSAKEENEELDDNALIKKAANSLRTNTMESGSEKFKRRKSNVSNMEEILLEATKAKEATAPNNSTNQSAIPESKEQEELDDLALIKIAASSMRAIEVDNDSDEIVKNTNTLASEPREKRDKLPPLRSAPLNISGNRRASITQHKVRSMSALGTKAYAAPEIKHQLRNKTTADLEKTNAALTDCVADYGMIVDAYSVGWTLRVVLTGVPPNSTISKYMRKYNGKEPSQDFVEEVSCCCPCLFGGGGKDNSNNNKDVKNKPRFRVRDTDEMPREATLFISALTKRDPEERMSIRQAQLHPWVKGREGEPVYVVPQGDYPSHHGDPVVPLKCAGDLTRVAEAHNYNKQ